MELVERWQNRRTERWFGDKEVEITKIEKLCNIIPCIPAQQGIRDHFWICIDKSENELRDFLFHDVFISNPDTVDGNDEGGILHFGSILTAPYIFLGIEDRGIHHDMQKNMGLHAGVLLAAALELELDAATMGCIAGMTKYDEFNKLIRKNRQFDEGKMLCPRLAVCVGYAQRKNKDYIIRDGLRINTQLNSEKTRKPNNFVGRS